MHLDCPRSSHLMVPVTCHFSKVPSPFDWSISILSRCIM